MDQNPYKKPRYPTSERAPHVHPPVLDESLSSLKTSRPPKSMIFKFSLYKPPPCPIHANQILHLLENETNIWRIAIRTMEITETHILINFANEHAGVMAFQSCINTLCLYSAQNNPNQPENSLQNMNWHQLVLGLTYPHKPYECRYLDPQLLSWFREMFCYVSFIPYEKIVHNAVPTEMKKKSPAPYKIAPWEDAIIDTTYKAIDKAKLAKLSGDFQKSQQKLINNRANGTTLFVRGVPFRATTEQLKDTFLEFLAKNPEKHVFQAPKLRFSETSSTVVSLREFPETQPCWIRFANPKETLAAYKLFLMARLLVAPDGTPACSFGKIHVALDGNVEKVMRKTFMIEVGLHDDRSDARHSTAKVAVSGGIRQGQRVPCKFFAEGHCRKGQTCSFYHDTG